MPLPVRRIMGNTINTRALASFAGFELVAALHRLDCTSSIHWMKLTVCWESKQKISHSVSSRKGLPPERAVLAVPLHNKQHVVIAWICL
jgi:hypothetical protein